MTKPFDVKIDHIQRVITIQGIRYTFDLFDQLGFAETGLCFEIGKRHNGAVELIQLPRRDPLPSFREMRGIFRTDQTC